MKKIKGLLLFGILTLLGIGSSFAYNYNFFPVEYFSIDNQYSNYLFNGGSTKNNTFMSLNGGTFTSLSKFFRYNSSTLDDSILNFSNYFLTGNSSLNYASPYLFVENDKNVSLLFASSKNSYGSYLFRITSGVSSYSSLFSQDVPSFIRVSVNGLDGISYENIFSSIFPPESVRSFIFTPSSVYDSNRGGFFNDLTYSGVDYVRGGMAPGVFNQYSFSFSPSISTSGNVAEIDPSSIPYYFATVTPSNGDWGIYTGLFILKLDTLYKKTNTGDFRILAIALTGSSINENTLDFIYSRYSCPSFSFVFAQCSFIDGGYLRSSNLANSFTSYNGVLYSLTGNYLTNSTTRYRLFQNLLYFLTTSSSNLQGSLSPVIYSVESVNIIQLYRPFYPSAGSFDSLNFSFGLSPSEGVNIFNYIGVGGGGNQSTGSIAINTGLLDLCLNDLQFGELNSYLCNQLLSNLGNPVEIPGTSGQYISVSIDENGNLRYWITTQEDLVEQMSGFVWVENEDGTRSTICPSGDCLGSILAKPIIHTDSGEVFEFTTGSVLDMLSNLTGWVGRCPFLYTDFRLGKNLKLLQLLQDYGFKYDPFIIINCSVAGFQYGRHTIDNTFFGDTFKHPLLYGDTPKHRTLFVFLDFVVILGLFGLFSFIKKIF